MRCKIFLSKKAPQRISKGHNWIFDHEIADIQGEVPADGLVYVYTHTGSFLGLGFYHPHSTIAIRIYSRHEGDLDFEVFFRNKFQQALSLRHQLCHDQRILRLFHSETDGLSGLYIDRYDKHVVVQILTKALENRQESIVKIIKTYLDQDDIIHIEQSNSLRTFEGLKILENIDQPFDFVFQNISIKYLNRLSYNMEKRALYAYIHQISSGKNVWDLFCGMGAFSLHALGGMTRNVLSVDNNNKFIDHLQTKINFIKHSDKSRVVCENVFDGIKTYAKKYFKPDIIIIDPPAFNIKNNELKAYRELAIQSFKQINENGILLIGYQSAHIHPDIFFNMIKDVGNDLKKEVILLRRFESCNDTAVHPLYAHHLSLNFWAIKIQSI